MSIIIFGAKMYLDHTHRLSTKEAADLLGYSVSTLRHWRKGCKKWRPDLGPHFFAINGRIWYSSAGLQLWMSLHLATAGNMRPSVS